MALALSPFVGSAAIEEEIMTYKHKHEHKLGLRHERVCACLCRMPKVLSRPRVVQMCLRRKRSFQFIVGWWQPRRRQRTPRNTATGAAAQIEGGFCVLIDANQTAIGGQQAERLLGSKHTNSNEMHQMNQRAGHIAPPQPPADQTGGHNLKLNRPIDLAAWWCPLAPPTRREGTPNNAQSR